jgi:hypothetical protein
MVMRGAVRLVLIGSLSRWQARRKFSRIKAESEYGAAEFLTKPVDVDQLKNSMILRKVLHFTFDLRSGY